MRQTYQIVELGPGGKIIKGIESHENPRDAFRAMVILQAHEVKNGRSTHYAIEPDVDCSHFEIKSLGLPQWVIDILELDS